MTQPLDVTRLSKRFKGRPTRFTSKLYFIRKVYEQPGTKRGYIDILREQVLLPRAYINMFVLAEWRLKSDKSISKVTKRLPTSEHCLLP